MKNLTYYLSLAVLLFFSCSQRSNSQSIPFTYRSIWEKAGCPGGIPEIKRNIVNVMDKGAVADGTTDNFEIIQSAIDNAAVPGVIFFPEGVYRINGQLRLKSGMILRGADPKKTRLEFYSQKGCILASGTNSNNYVKITSGSGFGSTKIVVADASGFKVGDGGHIRQGMVHKVTLTWLENPRTVGQMVKITKIKGNILTIEPALNFDYASNPPLDGLGLEISKVSYIERAGIENLHIKRIHSDATGGGDNINFIYASNSWVKRVESEYTLKYHISISQSLNLEIRENFVHHARSRGGGGQGYGVSLAGQTTATMVEDNIFYELRHSMISQTGVNGCVIGYNYAERNYDDNGGSTTAISFHGHYTHMNLVEGNVVSYIGIGDWWGPDGPNNTIFRNRVLGSDRGAGFGDYRGIMYRDYDGPEYIIANEIIGGKIYFENLKGSDSNASLVIVHGNNLKGTVSWQPGFSGNKFPASLYRNSKPAFFKKLKWPAFGGENEIGTGTIPALERWRTEFKPEFHGFNSSATP